ncbi:MAG TPA: YdeI/OmpD-associated family protein, partial [Verrucomicrobiae bacterium]|nr:YdeI/OmpD-associated family protein [Verrucomicrobiae bacterium]
MNTHFFSSSADFRRWLGENHARSEGIWLRLAKKDSGETSVTYAEALDQALCHGWIDGVKQPKDDKCWLQRFTPRKPKSRWSKLNTGHVERLIREGQMTVAGLKAVEAAKADGRRQAAYDSSASAAPPEDFLKELRKSRKALAFFKTLNRANVYAVVYRLQTAKKPET